jgi:hypothetical protein
MCCRCRCRSVGWLCVCFVYGLVVVHTPGIAVCAALPCWLPPFIGRRLHGMHAQFNYAVFVCVDVIPYIWCVSHTPTPPPTLSNTHTHMHMSSRACIPKVICICEHGTVCTYYNNTLIQ